MRTRGIFIRILWAGLALAAAGDVLAATPTTTTLTSSANPSHPGQVVTLTATIGNAVGPTGTINFFEGATSLCSFVTVVNAKATCTVTPALGAHDYSAVYSGNGSYLSSSGALTQNVTKFVTSVLVATAPSPSTIGQSVTITATVQNGGTPTGSVGFTNNGGAIAGCTAVSVSAAQATCTLSSLTIGSHTIAANYTGDANNASSSGNTTHVVDKVATTTTMTSSPNPSTPGQTVTLSATVSGTNPTGNVTFKTGTTTIAGCASAALNGAHTATCTTTALAGGVSSLTATYNGDATNATSVSAAVQHTVSRVATTTTLTSTQNPSPVGAALTLTATVSGAGTPTGTVVFRNGGAAISTCNGVALNGAHVATCNVALPVGSYNLTADYSGDADDAPSSSATLAQSIVKATSTATLSTPCKTTFVQNQTTTFTLSIGGYQPTGSATFDADLDSIPSCTVQVVSTVATCTTNSLTAGAHDIVATYFGDTNNTGSGSNTLHVTVLAANDALFRGAFDPIPANCPAQ